MTTVVRSYTALPDITSFACGLNSSFDTLYSTINDLDSANIERGLYFESSQITIVDTASNYASSELEGAMAETTSLVKGLNTIHVVPQLSNAVIVFPGKVEIGNQLCTVSKKFTIAADSIVAKDSGGGRDTQYFLAQKPATGEEITATDVFVCQNSSVTAGYNISARGYYYEDYRVIGALNDVGGLNRQALNWTNPDPVQKSFRLHTSDSGIETLFGITQSFGGIAGTYLDNISVFYDRTLGSYGYMARLNMSSQTETGAMGAVSKLYNFRYNIVSAVKFFDNTAITMVPSDTAFRYSITAAGTGGVVTIVAKPQPYYY